MIIICDEYGLYTLRVDGHPYYGNTPRECFDAWVNYEVTKLLGQAWLNLDIAHNMRLGAFDD